MQGGEYRCAYCGHLSLPPKPVVDQAARSAMLMAMLSQFEERRTRASSARDELQKRAHDAAASTRRTNSFVMLGIGGLFLLFALPCFGGALAMGLSASGGASHHHGHSSGGGSGGAPLAAVAGVAGFGLFWLALGGFLFYIGLRYRRAGGRDRRMREQGLRGCAIVKSYRESNLVVDGNSKFDLVLEVEVPGRAPFLNRQADYVPHPSAVTTGAELPVFVDPSNASDVMIDWFTTGRA
jgi:hypothetical protein